MESGVIILSHMLNELNSLVSWIWNDLEEYVFMLQSSMLGKCMWLIQIHWFSFLRKKMEVPRFTILHCSASGLGLGHLMSRTRIRAEFPCGQVAKTPHSQCKGLGLIPGQGTRSHMLQLRLGTAKKKKTRTKWELPEQILSSTCDSIFHL